jgi:hypothetical protein
MIPQRRERHPALRAAVPATREIPEHAKPRPISSSAAASLPSPGQRLSTLGIQNHASRNRHAAQQTPSAAANHALHAKRVTVREPADASRAMTDTCGPAGEGCTFPVIE